MMRRSLAVVLFVLSASLVGMIVLPSASASTLYVGGAGPGNYTTIQGAIDDAQPGDTVYVYDGSYPENVHIWKSVSLVGEDRDGTIIDGGGINDVVRVEADNVLIMSFTLMNSGSGYPDAGVSFQDMWNGQATDNLILNNYLGVYASRYAGGIGIENNDFLNTKSIAVLADETQGIGVGDNNITGSWVVFGGFASGMITGNYIDGGGIALAGIDGWAPYWTFVGGNHITNGGGIRLEYTWDCTVAFNTVVSNSIGIGLHLAAGTTLFHNNIIDNDMQALDYNDDGHGNRTNWWDTGSEGNYWSDYTGVDADGDGIGDTPYVIDDDTQDNYPLMNPQVSRPSPPQDLRAWAGNQRVTLTWREPLLDGGSPVTNYSIYRGMSPGGETFLEEVGDVTEYTDVAVVNGQRYYYQVSAKNVAGEGPKSNEANTVPLPEIEGPSNVSAILLGMDHEDIGLTWHLSPDDAAGFVDRYDIFRASFYDPSAAGYQIIASAPSGISQFTDPFAGDGDPKDYFYAVCSVDLNGKHVCAKSQAGKFTRPLSQGPNLVSIPLIQVNASVDRVLQTVEYDMAWAFDPASKEWRSYAEGHTYRTLDEVNRMTGIWISVTEDCNLTVAGIVPAQTEIQLHTGWNLVAFPSFSSYTVADLKAETGATRVEGYDLAPPYFLKVLTDGEVLQAGEGYWVKVYVPVVWVVGGG